MSCFTCPISPQSVLVHLLSQEAAGWTRTASALLQRGRTGALCPAPVSDVWASSVCNTRSALQTPRCFMLALPTLALGKLLTQSQHALPRGCSCSCGYQLFGDVGYIRPGRDPSQLRSPVPSTGRVLLIASPGTGPAQCSAVEAFPKAHRAPGDAPSAFCRPC